jgi:hypothetical protein
MIRRRHHSTLEGFAAHAWQVGVELQKKQSFYKSVTTGQIREDKLPPTSRIRDDTAGGIEPLLGVVRPSAVSDTCR